MRQKVRTAGRGKGPTTTLTPALLDYGALQPQGGRPPYGQEAREAFLRAYITEQTHSHAAQGVGVSLKTVRRWVEDEPAFREALMDARQMFTDEVKAGMVRRLRSGRDRNPVPSFFWLQHQDQEFRPKARPQVSITITDPRFQKVLNVVAGHPPEPHALPGSQPALDAEADPAEVF